MRGVAVHGSRFRFRFTVLVIAAVVVAVTPERVRGYGYGYGYGCVVVSVTVTGLCYGFVKGYQVHGLITVTIHWLRVMVIVIVTGTVKITPSVPVTVTVL